MFKWVGKVWDAIPDCSWPFHLLIHWLTVPPSKPPYPITEKCEIPPGMVGHYKEGTSTCINKRNQIEDAMKCFDEPPMIVSDDIRMDGIDLKPGSVRFIKDLVAKTTNSVAKPEEKCGNCKFWHVIYDDIEGWMVMGAVCRRRCNYIDKKEDEWCGEFRWKKGL